MSMFRENYSWADPSTYVDEIMKRSELRGWGFERNFVESALSGIDQHRDALHPSAFKLFLGRGARYDWAEANAWLADVLKGYEVGYLDNCSATNSSDSWYHYASNSGPVSELKPQLEAVYLDLYTYDMTEEMYLGASGHRTILSAIDTMSTWPGTDLIWLFALNPEMYLRGWDSHTNLMLPGIVLTSEEGDSAARNSGASTGWGFIPKIVCSEREAFIAHRGSSCYGRKCLVSYAV